MRSAAPATLVSATGVVGHKTRLEQQVFGGVAGKHELGEDRQVRALFFGSAQRGDHPLGVATEVADHRVDLAQSHRRRVIDAKATPDVALRFGQDVGWRKVRPKSARQ